MSENKLPYISVIITAYNRKEFLLNAIKSALNQTLDKKYYEIIVIKNFTDKDIDDFINQNKIIRIISNQESLGGKLVEALNIARGTVISFLEDDDLFFENKLDIVYKKFKTNKNIVYYHNWCVPINIKGEILNINNINTSPDSNMSAISMRKSIVKINKLNKILTSMPQDVLMYLYALESNQKIIKGKEKLTYYMLHNSTSNIVANNFDEYRKFGIVQSHLFLNIYKLFYNLVQTKKAINYLDSRITATQIYLYILGSNELPNKLINYIINSSDSLRYRVIFFVSCIVIYIYPKFRKYISSKMWNIHSQLFNEVI